MRTIPIFVVLFVVVSVGSAPAMASEPPLADAGLDQTVTPGTTVHLDANGSRDPDGRITDVEWTIDGPRTSSARPDCRSCRQTTFRPTTVGRYEVTLTVTDDDGRSRSDTLEVIVRPDDGPTVALTAPQSARRGAPTTVRADLTAGSANLSTVAWVVDGTLVRRSNVSGTDQTATLTRSFDTDGTVSVRAVAYDVAGRRGAATRSVRISQPVPPTRPGTRPGGAPPSNPPASGGPSFRVTGLAAPSQATVGTAVPITATVENNGTADGQYRATLLVASTDAATRTVEVDAGRSESVTFRHTFSQPGTYTVAVGNRSAVVTVTAGGSGPGGRIFVQSLTLPSDVVVGTPVGIYGTVRNTDTTARSLDVTLSVDGRSVTSRRVTVPPGSTQYVEFRHEFTRPGQHRVSINDPSRTIAVADAPSPPRFTVDQLTVPDRTLDVGERARMVATVRNEGDLPGRYDATLSVDGTPVANRSVRVAAGDTGTVRFDHAFETTGTHTVRVGRQRESVEVTDQGAVWATQLSTPDEIESGEFFEVNATIRNTRDAAALINVPLYIDGDRVRTKRGVVIPPDDSVTLVWRNRHLVNSRSFRRDVDVRVRRLTSNVTVLPIVADGGDAGSTCENGYVWTDADGDVVGCLDEDSTDIHYSDDGDDVWIDANGKDGLQISDDGELVTIMNESEVAEYGGKIPGEVINDKVKQDIENDAAATSPDVDISDPSEYNPGSGFKPGNDGDCGPMGCSTDPADSSSSPLDPGNDGDCGPMGCRSN